MKLITRFYMVSKLRMSEAIPPFPHTSLWLVLSQKRITLSCTAAKNGCKRTGLRGCGCRCGRFYI